MIFDNRNSATLYVSPSIGNDTANGFSPIPTEDGDGPLATLEEAIARVGKMRSEGVLRPMTVALCEDYFLSSPLSLSVSGVTLTSHGTRRRLIGGVRITDWHRAQLNGIDCLCAQLPDELSPDFTDLYAEGRRADAPRYPKKGTLRIKEAEEFLGEHDETPGHLLGSSRYVLVHPEDLAPLSTLDGAMLHYYHFWIDEHTPIESYERESGKLTMAYASRFSVSAHYDGHDASAMHYYLTGVKETFGTAGEWYLDRPSRTVYYIPIIDVTPDTLEAYAPTLTHLCDITADDVRLCNLELFCTRADYASTYYFDDTKKKYLPGTTPYGSDIQSVCWAPGAIRMRSANRSWLYNCYVHFVGPHAVEVGEGCTNTRIERCLIEDAAAGGIKIQGGEAGTPDALRTEHTVVRDNEIRHLGRRYEAGCGVFVAHASYNEIENNEIHDLAYSGISVGFVWGYGENPTFGNLIRGNHIYNVGMGSLSDMGGIYLLGKQSGTVVSQNRIHDVICSTYGAWGLYLDEGSSFVTVEDNVVYRTGKESFHLHYGTHNTVRNNILFGVGGSCFVNERTFPVDAILLEGNILVTDGAPIYGPDYAIETPVTAKNLLFTYGKDAPTLCEHKNGTTYDLDMWQKECRLDLGSIIADPMFVDAEHFDFRLKENSPALKIGFKPLPDSVAMAK